MHVQKVSKLDLGLEDVVKRVAMKPVILMKVVPLQRNKFKYEVSEKESGLSVTYCNQVELCSTKHLKSLHFIFRCLDYFFLSFKPIFKFVIDVSDFLKELSYIAFLDTMICE